ncbi:MAG TPA: MraY family glycosyltransferase [Thermoanaerobaculia bacterium]|nr:MraY family glycosyltransferase [Thermoanaerobaculia bacterium]
MNGILLYAAGAAFVAALATNLMVSPVVRLAVALRALDHPGERKRQAGAVPRLGGVAIVLGLALGGGVVTVAQWGRLGMGAGRGELFALALGTALVFLVGVLDDMVGVSAAKKFLFQLLAAWLLVRVGWSFEVLRLPGLGTIDLGIFRGVVSLLFIVGVTNAINLIDGLDGLAGGVATIISLSFLAYAILQGNPGTVILMASLAGACIGFLRHNWEPARIFMGDSGSLTLGFLLAATAVHSSLKAPATVAILVPFLALGVPVMDTLLVMAVRFLDRPKGPFTTRFLRMFRADRNHLHHILEHFGGKRSRIVAVIYAVVLSFCALALLVAVTGQTVLGIALVVLEFTVVLAMRRLGMAMEAGRLSRLQREEIKTELGLPAKPETASIRRIAR